MAFIVEVLCKIKQTRNNSDVVRCVLEVAERVLGSGGVEPATVHNYMFSRDTRARQNVYRTVKCDDT